MPFARWPDFEACTLDMKRLGHDSESADKICGTIQERAEKGALLKADVPYPNVELLSKAEDPDIYVGGYASYECVDNEGDLFTVEAQQKALERFFAQPPEFRLVTVDHGRGIAGEINVAIPVLKLPAAKAADGKDHYTHVNEKGTYLISQLRQGGPKVMDYFRAKAKAGGFTGYSVNAFALRRDPANPKRVLDMEYSAITLTEELVPRNPKTRALQVLSKAGEQKDVRAVLEDILTRHGF